MFIKKIILNNEIDTQKFAEHISQTLQKGDCVCLHGDLGAGKTSFSRSLIRHLGESKQDVPSPTFTLVQFYDVPKFTIWHFDLYRIKHPEEVYELGWEDALHDGVCLVEWPKNAGHLIPEDHIEIEFFFTGNNEEREVTVKGLGSMEERLSGASL
jgi:tRNA threonylcarbamoyl adenosine modification protein YjeE